MADVVLLPVFNEESTVSGVLDAVRDHFDGEIIVVDDGSTDETARVLAMRTDITLVTHPSNLGYGRALAEGFALAHARSARSVVTMDCDGQHEPAHICRFLATVRHGADIVSGSRYLPGSRELGSAPASRREVNARVTAEVNRVTGWGLTDAFCGFKAYRLSSLDRISLSEPGYAMPMELWAKAFKDGLEVVELPVERIYYDHDRSFGEDLDDPEIRFAYYMRVWQAALEEDSP